MQSRGLFSLTLLLGLILTQGGALGGTALPAYHIDTVAGNDRRGDGGPAAMAQFGTIQAVAIDRSGAIFLADTDFHRIRKISSAGIVTTLAGNGNPGFSGDGGPAIAAQLNLPYGLAVDSGGNLYVADLGNQRVRRITPDGIITTVAGNGQKASQGDDGTATGASLNSPRNLAIDSAGNLFIAEFDGNRIRRVTPDGRIATVAGTGVAGFSGDGFPARFAQLGAPAGIATDATGNLYICDTQSQRVRKLLTTGQIVTVLGGAPGTKLEIPLAIAVDRFGTIFVGDRSATIRQYSVYGAWTTTAGISVSGFSGDDGPATAARLASIRDLALDATGNLYIADDMRLRRVDPKGIIKTIAGDAYLHYLGDGGPATTATLLRPGGIALDATGNLLLADSGTGRIRRMSAAGDIVTVSGDGTSSVLNSPSAIAVAADGSVLVADTGNNRIRALSPGGVWRLLAGTGLATYGPPGMTGDRTSLNAPRGICADRTGNGYIVDTGNHRVLRLPPAGVTALVAGTGVPGDQGDGGPALSAQLNRPSACTIDADGNLYLADTASHRVRKVTAAGVISTVAGTGTAGFAGDEGPAGAASLSSPAGLALAPDGTLFIADTGNQRIRAVSTDGVIHTVAGSDVAAYAGDGGAALAASLNTPLGLAVDSAGIVFVADSGNNRIRRLTPSAVAVETPLVITVESAAGSAATAIAPGELIRVRGAALGPDAGVTSAPDASGYLPVLLAGTQVLFDGAPAPIVYTQASEVVAQVPYTLGGRFTVVEVRASDASRGLVTLAVADAAPALFGSVVKPDSSVVSPANPATRGAVVTFLATGTGLFEGANQTGLPAGDQQARPLLPVRLRIAGLDAEILSAVAEAGQVGVLRIDARIPSGFVPPGETAAELFIGTFAAPPLTLWLE